MEVYSDIFRLGDGFIQTEGEPGGLCKANPIILGSFGGHYDSDGKLVGDRRRRRILFEDTFEETLAEFRDANWAITNGLTYWGRANTADAQSKMCAMIFDLDGQDDGTLTAFLYNCRSDYPVYPEPNYIILSGHNVHLYYVLEEPADLYPNTKSLLKDMKYHLTDRMWNKHTSREWEHPQHQGINQGFRVIGGKTKDGGTVRAFAVNTHPFSLEELNDFLPPEQQVDLSKKWRETRYTLEQAKERFPEWYEKVIVGGGRADGSWNAKEDLYNWWLRKIRAGATFSHRYFCLMALAIYAVKCGITDRKRVKADMDSLVPFLDSVDTEHPFGNDHEVENALECLDLRYKKFPIKDLERISGIAIPKNKRNYRKQALHLRMARSNLEILSEDAGHALQGRPKGSGEKRELIRSYAREHPDANHSDIAKALGVSRSTVIKWLRGWRCDTDGLPDGAWRNKDGAPTKADLVREYAAEHPDANHSEIARALGISRPTVIKWLKDVPKGATEPEKPKPDDLYELYNPAMVELRAALDEYSSSANDRGYLSPPQSAMTRLELTQKAIGLDTGVEEYWKRVDVENEKREKRERETVKSSGTTVKLPDVSRETFPIDDRLNNGHNEA